MLPAVALVALAILPVQAARAQVSGRISVDSGYRSRGYSVADAAPVVTGSLGYDHPSGLYANGFVLLGIEDPKVGMGGVSANLGYAVNVTRGVSIDAGIARTQYARTPGGALNLRYTEAYAGATAHGVTARAYYSPDYFGRDRHTLYSEVETTLAPLPDWALTLHLGALAYLSAPPPYTARARYDWRANASRTWGPVQVYAEVSGRGRGGDYYARSRSRAVATFGAAIVF